MRGVCCFAISLDNPDCGCLRELMAVCAHALCLSSSLQCLRTRTRWTQPGRKTSLMMSSLRRQSLERWCTAPWTPIARWVVTIIHMVEVDGCDLSLILIADNILCG